MGKVLFVTGIDTNIGKTYATGLLAKAIAAAGKTVITQKMIQTGCQEVSEDIEMHRKIQGISFTEEDRMGLTCPYIFTYPCSPHMAADRDGRTIDYAVIGEATRKLQEKYEYVLLEGAGGLMVPLTGEYLTIDYIADKNYPLIFVTSGKLGSINHTLISLEAIGHRGITLDTVLYNLYPTVEDKTIQNDTMQYIREYLSRHFPGTKFEVVPEINNLHQTM